MSKLVNPRRVGRPCSGATRLNIALTAAEFLSTKCSNPSLPPDFDHLDMSLLCFLAGKHALAAAWAKQPCAVVGVTDRYWRSLVMLSQQRLADGQIKSGDAL